VKWIDTGETGWLRSRIAVRRISQTTVLTFALTISAHAQQIASMNLLRPSVADAALTRAEERAEHPNGCPTMGVGFADGVTLNEDKVPTVPTCSDGFQNSTAPVSWKKSVLSRNS